MLKIKVKEFKELLKESISTESLKFQSQKIAEAILQALENASDDNDIAIYPVEDVQLKFTAIEDETPLSQTKKLIIERANKLAEAKAMDISSLLHEIMQIDDDILIQKYMSDANLEDAIANLNAERTNECSEDECDCEICNGQCLSEFLDKEEISETAEDTNNAKNIAITMIKKDTTEKYIGKLPIVFLGTEDRSFGAGIAKFYADKYPKMRKRNCGKYTDYLSVYRGQELLEQDECSLDNIGQQNNDIMFCALTPKADRYSKMSDALFETSLHDLFELLKDEGIEEIAMPRIGSRREGMDWSHTEYLIEKIGREYGFEILWIVQDND